jgi:hypothetical protein
MSEATTLEARIQRLEDMEEIKKLTATYSFTNPIIDIDGNTATGTWLLWVAGTNGDDGTEVFQSEDLIYARTPEGWRIKSLNLHFGALRNI